MDQREQEAGGISTEGIVRALDAIRVRIEHAERERGRLDRLISQAREEQRLLERLLALRKGEPVEPQVSSRPPVSAGTDDQPHRAAVQAVVTELAGAGRPVHISELMRLLRERNVVIPGAGTQANLITHLRRDDRLVRPSRGMYALAAWGLENMPAGAGKKRRKRVRVAAKEARPTE